MWFNVNVSFVETSMSFLHEFQKNFILFSIFKTSGVKMVDKIYDRSFGVAPSRFCESSINDFQTRSRKCERACLVKMGHHWREWPYIIRSKVNSCKRRGFHARNNCQGRLADSPQNIKALVIRFYKDDKRFTQREMLTRTEATQAVLTGKKVSLVPQCFMLWNEK